MSYGSFYPHTFQSAEKFIAGGRSKTDRPVANNTRLRRIDDDSIALVLHSTAVVTYHRDGTYTIYGGGWNTVTTKARIKDYSPARPSSDGHNGWAVGWTGEITPPRVQKCRTCKGRGRWMADDECYGPRMWGDTYCPGGRTEYAVPYTHSTTGDFTSNWDEHSASRYVVPCLHGKEERHPTEPCGHDEWKRHVYGQSERECYRCKGEGIVDYGSNRVPITVDASTPYRVNSDGEYLESLPYAPNAGDGYSPKKSTHYYGVPIAAKPAGPHIGSDLADDLAAILPDLEAQVKHPVSGDRASLRTTIVSLNDTHHWSRERVADWLDTLDLNLRFPVPSAI